MPALKLLLVHDGKPGHRTQADGLAAALQRATDCQLSEANCGTHTSPQIPEPAPDWVISVGRHSAPYALKIAAQCNARCICLMNPGWWLRRKFDMCIPPAHDGLDEAPRVLVTRGALNAVPPSPDADITQTLCLIGGPSKHHSWDEMALVHALEQIIETQSEHCFLATSSRRTPETTEQALKALSERYPAFEFIPASDTPRGWVADKLRSHGSVWVSGDSISMIYEALSAGAATGLLPVPIKRHSRVIRGVEQLTSEGLVTPYNKWQSSRTLARHAPLQEADRIASALLKLWA